MERGKQGRASTERMGESDWFERMLVRGEVENVDLRGLKPKEGGAL